MLYPIFIAFLTLFISSSAHAQLLGNGPELQSLTNFSDGKFQLQSVKSIYWPQIATGGRPYVQNAEKTWVPSRLYMPSSSASKVPVMVIVHGIGGLYMKDGSKRAYWE